ncbi:MAG: murein biosynthesis integral membrane protein MurJ [Candidatus Velthaea sp.]
MSRRLTVVARPAPATRRLARSTVLVMAVTLASTSLGFAREVVFAKFFGASWQLDSYLAAAVVPTILFGVFNGALVSALVPIFSDYLATDREAEAWRLGWTLIVGVTVTLTVAAALGSWLAPAYVPLFWRFHGEQLQTTIEMTRWLMPSIVATSLSGIIAAMLNAHQRFAAAALQGVALNVVVISIVVAGFGRYGVMALVAGTLAGYFAQVAVQVPALIAAGGFHPVVDLNHPGLRRLTEVLGPIAIGSAAGQLALFFDRLFASGLSEGSISGMNYAVKVVGFPQQIFVTAIATVIFPIFASQFARRNRVAMRRSIATGLQMVVFLTLPSALELIVLAGPIVRTLFERGAFSPEATVLCASLLPYAAAGLVALAANVILTRCIFACGEVAQPIAMSVLSVVLNVVLSLLWLPSLGARGLLLANAVSQTLQTVALGVIAWRLLGGFNVVAIVRSFLKVFGCSAIMVAALVAVQSFEPPITGGDLARIVSLGEHLAFGAAIFLALARLFDSDEVHLAIALLLRRERPRDLIPLG